MQIRQNKSRCEVIGDDGRRCYRSFKNRRDAEAYIEYMELQNEFSNRYWRMEEPEREAMRRKIEAFRERFKRK